MTAAADPRAGREPVLTVRGLNVEFGSTRNPTRVVDGVSFDVHAGETVALVGESGSGKTMTARSIIGLLPSGAHIRGGEVRLSGERIDDLDERALSTVRGGRIGMVFQEPRTAFDPLFTVGKQLTEGMLVQGTSRSEARRAAVEMLGLVGVSSPSLRMKQYPHQLSGGMLQRAMLASALLLEPELIILDEPTTGLDVSIQGQIIELLRGLRGRFDTAILLITHDLGVVAALSDSVVVMYASRVVEHGPATRVFEDPQHPYTQALLAAAPGSRSAAGVAAISGNPPSMDDLPSGCAFHPRCPLAFERCTMEEPPLFTLTDADSHPAGGAACWLRDPDAHGEVTR